MNGLGQIIANNARAVGKKAIAFTVYLIVDPKQLSDDEDTLVQMVSDEIQSALESVDFVDTVQVRRRITSEV